MLILLYWKVFHITNFTKQNCIALHIASLHYTAMYCATLHCTALHCPIVFKVQIKGIILLTVTFRPNLRCVDRERESHWEVPQHHGRNDRMVQRQSLLSACPWASRYSSMLYLSVCYISECSQHHGRNDRMVQRQSLQSPCPWASR